MQADTTGCADYAKKSAAIGTEALAALDALDDSVLIFDRRWRYLFVNRAGWLVLNRSKQEIIGKNVWQVMPHIRNTLFERSAKLSMKSQQKLLIEEYYPHLNKYYRTKFYPSLNSLTVHITDITELVEAQQVRDQLMGDLQGAMELYWSDANKHRRRPQEDQPVV